MKPQLNHLIVRATDRRAAANFASDIFGLERPADHGHFSDPHTRVGWEIVTRPYGSGPDAGQPVQDDDRSTLPGGNSRSRAD